jgi:D-alanyl-D-alanine carboxypeptidase/D-alanyl-D-alanine-endopeptidase (penicillin-binding protein 4)
MFYFFLFIFTSSYIYAGDKQNIERHIGDKDSVLVGHSSGRILYSKNAKKLLVPASTLKIITSLAALDHLGSGFRFKTEFYQDSEGNLKIKGYGDPLLISEAVEEISTNLANRIKTYNHLILDDTYFKQPLAIPGITSSWQPYDAPNGALCVNFNTVYFKRKRNGKYVSAEPQTPLLPYVLKRIQKSKLKKGRIIFSQERKDITLYAGHLFQYFLNQAGIEGKGNIRIGEVNEAVDRLVYTYTSRFTLEASISKLMKHSNNFMSNQVLITAGATAFGKPGNLDKAVKLAKAYAKESLKIDDIQIVEGSGISRDNKISADMLHKALMVFKPYTHLLKYEDGAYYKTGTLFGVSSRAGYIEHSNGGLYPFVVILNSKGKAATRFMKQIRRIVENSK